MHTLVAMRRMSGNFVVYSVSQMMMMYGDVDYVLLVHEKLLSFLLVHC
jgi:hypothetical protein